MAGGSSVPVKVCVLGVEVVLFLGSKGRDIKRSYGNYELGDAKILGHSGYKIYAVF